MERYYISPTPNSGGYYSVIDRARKNEFGERYALFCYLTKQEAEEFLSDVRKTENVTYAAEYLECDPIDANEDAEYGVEYNLYGDAETLKAFQDTDRNEIDGWRLISTTFSFAFEAYYATYRRYSLIDAARLEAR